MQDWARKRVYGADHDDLDTGPRPGREYRELVAGPLDGLLVDVTGWTVSELGEGAALLTELARYGGGRAVYAPRPGAPELWDWAGDTP
ncbi:MULTISPECIES: hypothetical protein [Streptomyces]|uniref:hypothetical protein n=1 Tax=Streptomyces TaxID=1883 RepID=UPI000CD4BC33|nr:MULTISPECIES: hypothetical protein [Streptomyces]